MSQKLTCPVCDRPEITDNICPNCETDLTFVRLLTEKKPVAVIPKPEQIPQPTITNKFTSGVVILILIMGISLGAVSSWLFLKLPSSIYEPAQSTAISPSQTSPQKASANKRIDDLLAKTPQTKPPTVKAKCTGDFRYKVRRGDHLWLIAERFYGKGKLWKRIAKANPVLEKRQNNLIEREILIIPNLEENCR
ncbi:Peptidoglycan-binding lysin domain protein [Crinalium epipsammum PCC 9333]|uniref:Peptidoglycan-binding lysin domain protein n=1 Tax=Crinalium epipsammum PCC 9333 TaxID=1173022 RepID=K9W5Z8_9CYAN|nr:LysM peptidoglycan-binding domain-containing protein [Crinalium epipsammum]AFZ15172.1 Peptidoglycan-binding lysin domain protein [Crinalium epipsammum PCC 9333]